MKMILRIHAGFFKDHIKSQHFSRSEARCVSQIYPIFDGAYNEACTQSASTRNEIGCLLYKSQMYHRSHYLQQLMDEQTVNHEELPF